MPKRGTREGAPKVLFLANKERKSASAAPIVFIHFVRDPFGIKVDQVKNIARHFFFQKISAWCIRVVAFFVCRGSDKIKFTVTLNHFLIMPSNDPIFSVF